MFRTADVDFNPNSVHIAMGTAKTGTDVKAYTDVTTSFKVNGGYVFEITPSVSCSNVYLHFFMQGISGVDYSFTLGDVRMTEKTWVTQNDSVWIENSTAVANGYKVSSVNPSTAQLWIKKQLGFAIEAGKSYTLTSAPKV